MDMFALSDSEYGITFCQPIRDKTGWLDSFVVRIKEPGLNAEARVENSGVIQGPETFFRDIAQSWRGWVGEKTWHALEGELALIATADSLGHITIRVQLQPTAGPDSWRTVTYAYAEAGQLDSLSSRAAKFFRRES